MKPIFKKLSLAVMIAGATFTVAGCKSNSSSGGSSSGGVELESNQVAIYFKRTDNTYDQWGLHLWDNDGQCDLADPINDNCDGTDWDSPMMSSGIHETHGAYYIIDLNEDRNGSQAFGFIIRDLSGAKNCENDLTYSVSDFGKDVYAIQDSCDLTSDPAGPPPLLKDAEAHLLNEG